jgi:hypothetical protein
MQYDASDIGESSTEILYFGTVVLKEIINNKLVRKQDENLKYIKMVKESD